MVKEGTAGLTRVEEESLQITEGGLATWEEYKTVVRGRREATRKAKASLEFNLARAGKDNRKGFFEYTADKTNSRGRVGPLMNEVGALVTEDTEKAELLNAFTVSVCSAGGCPEEPRSALLRQKQLHQCLECYLMRILKLWGH